MGFRLLLVILAGAAICAPAAERWEVRYFNDDDDTFVGIWDLRFVTPRRGMATGWLGKHPSRNVAPTPIALITDDGGRTWTQIRVPDLGRTLCLVDGDLGFMAGPKGIWRATSFDRWR